MWGYTEETGYYVMEMKHWLCVTNEDNWKIIKKKRIWGVPKRRKRTIIQVKLGDHLIFYIKHGKIGGIFKAISEPFESKEKIFKPIKKEIFPNRIKLEKVLIPKMRVDFKKLIPRLSFIRNKISWGFYMWSAIRMISKEDYKTIKSALLEAE